MSSPAKDATRESEVARKRSDSLSPVYATIKQLRSSGSSADAITALRTSPPTSDVDAFEAIVCLFVCGDASSAAHVCRTYKWTEAWALDIATALAESLEGAEQTHALTLAARAASAPDAPLDVSAFYLLLMQKNGRSEEAHAYISSRFHQLPQGETFLLTIMAEVAASSKSWREAYRLACAVLSSDPDDYRALLVLSIVEYELGNIHASLGSAIRAHVLRKGAAAAILQLMRCRNELGNHYAAIAAFSMLERESPIAPDARIELGRAYAGLGDHERAAAEYLAALHADPASVVALRALVTTYANAHDRAGLEKLKRDYGTQLHGDLQSAYALALEALAHSDIELAETLFRSTVECATRNGELGDALVWPVPEPRVRHDYEQLDLLRKRGKLDARGHDTLEVLRRYCGADTRHEMAFAPVGLEGDQFKAALCSILHLPQLPLPERVLGDHDYAAIEATYLAKRVVVIDNFLSAAALGTLRQFCEEATVWKFYYDRGYSGARLANGFSPKVLLAVADELKQRLPRVIGNQQLTQAWAFKYDQRMQGINLHADFAAVNVNFWITPDEACEDAETGGLIVYELPVPSHWTFFEYNNESEKLTVYLSVNKARSQRVCYKANRCVLFDSSLIHTTDTMHFKPGYANRRVNVTLLYGTPRNAE